MPQFRRILLKISGEALAGPLSFGLDTGSRDIAGQGSCRGGEGGVQIGLVLGGGNIFRGIAAAAHDMDRVQGDHMGMLATVINAWRSRMLWSARAFLPV
jgi:uridylate kinase